MAVRKDYILRVFICAALVVLSMESSYASEDKTLYKQGIRDARRSNIDFAFMDFDSLVREFPSSRYFEDALFATGEYRFIINNYTDSETIFKKVISNPKNTKGKLFAYAYLMKLAERMGQGKKVYWGYKKKILIFKQISLLFRNSQDVTYISPLQRIHKAVYFINKVVIYINNEEFLTVHF